MTTFISDMVHPPASSMSSALLHEFSKVIVVMALYWAVSIGMVFINKFLIGDVSDPHDISLFISWMQCLITSSIVAIKYFIQIIIFNDNSSATQFNIKTLTTMPVMFMSCTFVVLLTLNNLCLKHVGIAFFQMARSLTLLFTIVLTTLLLRQVVIKPRVIIPCLLVAFGFVLGVDQEGLLGTLSINGLLFGITTSFFVALNGILIKRGLAAVHQDAKMLTFYNNIIASVLFIPPILATGQLQSIQLSPQSKNFTFWCLLAVSGIMSLAMGWLSALQIQLTSPVTHHISANLKSVLQTIIAVNYYDMEKSLLWWCGVGCVLVGVTTYAVCGIDAEKQKLNLTTNVQETRKLKIDIPTNNKDISDVNIKL